MMVYGPLWSLAVEEQFYLVWPFLVWATSVSWLRRLSLTAVVLGPVIRSASALCLMPYADNALCAAKAAFFLPTTYVDAFAAGALLAIGYPALKVAAKYQKWLWAAGAIALALPVAYILGTRLLQITWSGRALFEQPPFFPRFALQLAIPNILFVLLLNRLVKESPSDGVFSNSSLRHIGRISYCLYMMHIPCQWFVRPYFARDGLFLDGTTGLATGLLISTAMALLLANLSLRYFEGPFLTHKAWADQWFTDKTAAVAFDGAAGIPKLEVGVGQRDLAV
jgi:peptidoglycan/LPS O-acetylase OafA/YrhL